MHSLLYLLLLTGVCFAHYRGSYDFHNFVVREEPVAEDDGVLVECPVCEDSEQWFLNNEKCTIKRGNKMYKKCEFGTYKNEVCGNRLDCYRGPNEQCTEKMDFDRYGEKCMEGSYCHELLGVCTGLGFHTDSHIQKQLIKYPFTMRRTDLKELSNDLRYPFEGGRRE